MAKNNVWMGNVVQMSWQKKQCGGVGSHKTVSILGRWRVFGTKKLFNRDGVAIGSMWYREYG